MYSKSEVVEYSVQFPDLSAKIRFVLYGRDFDMFETKQYFADEAYIASGGSTNRDFRTLAEALNILHESRIVVQCKVATRVGSGEVGVHSPNLEFHYDIRANQFGEFLQASRFVIIPLRKTELSGGHMMMLEAMSRKKAVIIAGTPGVRDYTEDGTVIMYEPESAEDLARAIHWAMTHESDSLKTIAKKAQEVYALRYTHVDLVRRLVEELECVEPPSIDAE